MLACSTITLAMRADRDASMIPYARRGDNAISTHHVFAGRVGEVNSKIFE